jgi:hypothetical protein
MSYFEQYIKLNPNNKGDAMIAAMLTPLDDVEAMFKKAIDENLLIKITYVDGADDDGSITFIPNGNQEQV